MESMVKDVHKALYAQKKILINEEIEQDIIEKVVMQIMHYNTEDDELEEDSGICSHCKTLSYDRKSVPILLYINSNGGCAEEMLSVISAIETSRTPVWTYVLGKAYSAGSIISMCGHKRLAQKHSRFMIHHMYTEMHGSLPHLVSKCHDGLEVQSIVNQIICSKTNITEEDIEKYTMGKNWTFGSSKALELGVIDLII